MNDWLNGTLPPGSILAITAIAGGCLLAIGLAWIRLRGRPRARHQQQLPDEAYIRSEIQDMMDQLDRLGERIDQQAEVRVAELRRLLTQADSTIAKLRSMAGQLQISIGQEETASRSPVMPPQSPEPVGSRTNEVLRLELQGLDAIEIARRTGMTVGEVELIMNLRPAGPGVSR